MRGPYSEYAAPPIYLYPDRPKPGVRFSRTELVQLGIAVLALSGAFTLVSLKLFYGGPPSLGAGSLAATIGILFIEALVSVGSGVGLHEIMHKVVAQRYGLWAEFRYSPQGLLMTFVLAFAGFLFGAPGATYIAGAVDGRQNGRISAAGPVTNIVLGIAFLGLELAVYPFAYAGTVAGYAYFIFLEAASINLILAGFNMIPILPLDGAKVLRWNVGVWAGILAVIVALFAFGVPRGILFL